MITLHKELFLGVFKGSCPFAIRSFINSPRKKRNNARRVFLLNLRERGAKAAQTLLSSIIKSASRAQELFSAAPYSTLLRYSGTRSGCKARYSLGGYGMVYQGGSEYLPGRSMLHNNGRNMPHNTGRSMPATNRQDHAPPTADPCPSTRQEHAFLPTASTCSLGTAGIQPE